MERTEVVEKIKGILKTIRSIDHSLLDSLTEETDFMVDLGVPSTELVNIIAKAEDLFDIEFEDDDVDDFGSTVGDTVDIILKTYKAQKG